MTAAAHLNRLREAGDNYNQTVLALRAFANEILFDDAAKAIVPSGSIHCGRRLKTSSSNRHSKNTTVTPDLTIFHSPSYGVIAEAKFGFDSDPKMFEARVQETVEQIEKYDDQMVGWPVWQRKSGVARHDVVLLVNFEDVRRVAREIKSRLDAGSFSVDRKFAVVSNVRIERSGSVWPVLSLESGELSSAQKTRKMADRIPIRPEMLANNPLVGLVKLHDVCPPLPVMMELIHAAIVGNLKPDELLQYRLEGEVDKAVTERELQQWLSVYGFKKADARDPLIPKPDWVKRAVTALVDLGWAERTLGAKDSLTYHHKKGRRGYNNPYGRFLEFCSKKLAEKDEKDRKNRERQEAKSVRQLEKEKKAHPLLADLIDREEPGDSPT